jgi:hypothetical protein
MPLPEIRTARLLLRAFEDRDLPAFAAINAEPGAKDLFLLGSLVMRATRS